MHHHSTTKIKTMNAPIKISIAKLLKEKGFKEPCFYYYDKQDKLKEPFLENGSSTDTEFRVDLTELLEYHNNSYSCHCSAPTISEVVMWLYEKHGVWINVKGDDNKTFRYELHEWIWYESEKTLRQTHVTFGGGIFDINSEEFNSPTEAYEAAIEYVLKEMIN